MFCDGEGYLNPEGNTAAALVLDNLICKPSTAQRGRAVPFWVSERVHMQTAARFR